MDTKTCLVVVIAAAMIVFNSVRRWAPSESVDGLTPTVSTGRVLADRVIGVDPPRFEFEGGTDAQVAKMQRAIDRFGDLGLELPSLETQFAEGCRERFGAWGRIRFDTTPWHIEVCTTAVFSHELAHAWDRWNLTDAERRAYMDVRGLEAWQGADIPWKERGEEDLAILVSRVVSQGVNNYRSEDRSAELHAFGQITGIPVPAGDVAVTTDARLEAPQYGSPLRSPSMPGSPRT